MPNDHDVDFHYLHFCLEVVSAIILSSPEGSETLREAHVDICGSLLDIVLAGSVLALRKDENIGSIGKL